MGKKIDIRSYMGGERNRTCGKNIYLVVYDVGSPTFRSDCFFTWFHYYYFIIIEIISDLNIYNAKLAEFCGREYLGGMSFSFSMKNYPTNHAPLKMNYSPKGEQHFGGYQLWKDNIITHKRKLYAVYVVVYGIIILFTDNIKANLW